MKALEKVVKSHDQTLGLVLSEEAHSTKRSDYDTIPQFMAAIQDRVRRSNIISTRIIPLEAIFVVLHEAKEEMLRYVHAKYEWIDEKPARAITNHDFITICQETCDETSLQRCRFH
jgi:hypothetical protein